MPPTVSEGLWSEARTSRAWNTVERQPQREDPCIFVTIQSFTGEVRLASMFPASLSEDRELEFRLFRYRGPLSSIRRTLAEGKLLSIKSHINLRHDVFFNERILGDCDWSDCGFSMVL